MKSIVLILVLLMTAPCALWAEQVYLKADTVLPAKPTAKEFVVTKKMKENAEDLGSITITDVKYKVAGVSNKAEAKQVIEALVKEGKIKKEQDLYQEQHPSVEVNFGP